MANRPDWLNERSAAIPIIKDNDGIKVVLVTTKPKHKGNWIFPKGQIELGMTGHDSAAKEAFEEAGVIGHTSPTLFGTYQQNKWGSRMQVQVYTMDVTEILETWDEMRDRDRLILPLDEAINIVQSSQKHVLIKLRQQIAPQAQQVTPAELNHDIQTGSNLVLLDVREANERPITGILSSNEVHIPLNFVENQAYSKIKDRNARVVVYCGKGIRGVSAANTLHKMGYTNVSNLKGGMTAWKEAGLKTLAPK
ncbi:MAG: rhodanese-like domain-containing protein [Pseudomonadota bacterium]|nr:rhodanese-like domain-containing protein [Pseudomonadota bacterium]